MGMDILDMVNKIIEKNEGDQQKLEPIIRDLNLGEPLENIIQKYNTTYTVLQKIFVYPENKNKLNTIAAGNIEKILTGSESEIDSQQLDKEEDIIVEKEVPEINLEVLVKELNDGNSIKSIASERGINKSALYDKLFSAKYSYSSLVGLWIKKTEKELIEELIYDLNKGKSIFDISGEFVEGRQNQTDLSNKIRKRIEREGYTFNVNTRMWEREEENSQEGTEKELVIKILTLLNNGVPLSRVKEELGLSFHQIRLKLKSHGYKFDSKSNVWIKKEAKLVNTNDSPTPKNFDTNEEVGRNNNNRRQPQENTQPINNEESKGLQFTEEEVQNLKEIVDLWKKSQPITTNGEYEIKLKLDYELFQTLYSYSNSKNISINSLILSAIDKYIN